MAILIKRYANRKLYNTETSRYITLKGIAALLDAGEEVRVIDKETGEDVTRVALSQILVDNQRAKEDPSDTLLTQILSKGGDALYGAIKKSVDDASDGLGDFQDRFRSFVNHPEGRSSGFGWDPRGRDRRDADDFGADDDYTSATSDTSADDHDPEESDHRSPFARSEARDARGRSGDSRSSGDSRGARPWPSGFAGLPDLRDAIQTAVSSAFDGERLDLREWMESRLPREDLDEAERENPHGEPMPTQKDFDTLNANLSRVAEAIERLERAMQQDSADD